MTELGDDNEPGEEPGDATGGNSTGLSAYELQRQRNIERTRAPFAAAAVWCRALIVDVGCASVDRKSRGTRVAGSPRSWQHADRFSTSKSTETSTTDSLDEFFQQNRFN